MASSRSVAWRQMIKTARKASAKSQSSGTKTLFSSEEEPKLESTPLLAEFYSRFPFVLGLLQVFSQKDAAQNPSRRYLWTGNYFLPTYFVYLTGKARNAPDRKLIPLAKTFQYFYLSQEFHKTIAIPPKGDHNYNKVSTLVGDLFITEAIRAVAEVKNNPVAEFAFETLAELCIQNFPSDQDHRLEQSSKSTCFYANAVQSVGLLNNEDPNGDFIESSAALGKGIAGELTKLPVQLEEFRAPLEALKEYISTISTK